MKSLCAHLSIFLSIISCSLTFAQCPEPPNPVQENRPGLLQARTASINPSDKNPARIPFFLPSNALKAELSIYSPDGEKLRTLIKDKLNEGENYFEWDGKDEAGLNVPNEAYIPVLTTWLDDSTPSDKFVDDPRTYSGGEILPELAREWKWSGKHDIAFTLDAPSRVLSRAVIKGGPLVKTIANWDAKPAGKVVLRWDGYDTDKVEQINVRNDFSVLVMGYCLPAHSLLVYGSKSAMDYHEYREKKKLAMPKVDWKSIMLTRGKHRLEKDYFLPRSKLPEMTLSFPDDVEKNEAGEYVINKPARLKVSIPQDQRWIIESSLYEVSYYYDYKFVQEEEQGYLPLYWPIDPADFSPGRHVVTVQISAFNGVFVSRSASVRTTK